MSQTNRNITTNIEAKINNLKMKMFNLKKITNSYQTELATAEILKEIVDPHFKLANSSFPQRISLLELAIKLGHIELVKTLTEKFIKEGLENDILIPSAQNPEVPYRPVFWLAAIVTRQENVPETNYQIIENYLCNTFNVPKEVNINGKMVTRQKYLASVESWKNQQNIKMRTNPANSTIMYKPFFPLYGLAEEIKQFRQESLDRPYDSKFNLQSELRDLAVDNIQKEMPAQEREKLINKILYNLKFLNIRKYDKSERIYLLDTAIKIGNVEIVKALAEKFIEQGFENDIKYPAKENMEHAYRPVFWLPSIVTKTAPQENYEAIEAYLLDRFNIPKQISFSDIACDLYILKTLPKNLNPIKHKNTFIFSETTEELFFIDDDTHPNKVNINDMKKFKQSLEEIRREAKEIIRQNEERIAKSNQPRVELSDRTYIPTSGYILLTGTQVKELITSNGGYSPVVKINREDYLKSIDKWKHKQNINIFRTFHSTKPRYRRHALLNEIEQGKNLKATKK